MSGERMKANLLWEVNIIIVSNSVSPIVKDGHENSVNQKAEGLTKHICSDFTSPSDKNIFK